MQKDSILILAWPQTPAKAIGRWYDSLTESLGFLKDGYYKAGHAACVLIDHSSGDIHYFDFGRYHMPQKFGRVRNKDTDPGLALKTKAILSSSNKLLNIKDILFELSRNKDCHGKGPLYASVLEKVDFQTARDYAINMQNKDAVKYGPYVIKGTNCSRFISSTAKAAMPSSKIKFRLTASLLLTPLTKANVFACNTLYYRVEKNQISKQYLTYKEQLKNFMLPFYFKSKKQNIKKRNFEVFNNQPAYELIRVDDF